MNITSKILITDTNIITDLYNAGVLDKFVVLDNVYISDMVLRDEINDRTGDVSLISKMKTVEASALDLLEMQRLSYLERRLSYYDLINFIIARDHEYILATGDNLLKKYAEDHGVEVIRTLKIIQLMVCSQIISYEEGIHACQLLLDAPSTRIPRQKIIEVLEEFQKEAVVE